MTERDRFEEWVRENWPGHVVEWADPDRPTMHRPDMDGEYRTSLRWEWSAWKRRGEL